MNDRAYSNFYGFSNLLLDIHRQFDVLFAGDNVWLDDNVTIDQLNQYKMIILPNVADISDNQLDLLLDYVKTGGKVFAFGETGARNELGQPREKARLADLLVEGNHPIGQGQFVYASDNIGTNYPSNNTDKYRQKIETELSELDKGDIKTNASPKVSILESWNPGLKASIIHLINHDYDTQKQQINPQKNISMEINLNKLLPGKDLGVFYVSPDWKETRELEFSLSDGIISFTIPDLDTYGVIYIGARDSFPVEPASN